MSTVPNFQQIFDSHLHDSLNDAFGTGASGGNWIDNPASNIKNKYAVIREYRTLNQDEVITLVNGRTGSNLGAMIITTTRFVAQPLAMNGKRYGARLETIMYMGALNVRQSQIGGNRVTYEMIKDAFQVIIDNPLPLNNLNIPFVIQTGESEFTTKEMDMQRMIIFIPTSQLTIHTS